MPNWDLDPALFLIPQFQAQAPAEEIACVICTDSSADDQPHIICVVDVNPTSRSYGEVVGEIALDRVDAPPLSWSHGADIIASARHASDRREPGPGYQIAPSGLLAHDPTCPFGFVSSGFNQHDLTSGISVWRREDGPHAATPWALRQVIIIGDEASCAGQLPDLLQSLGAVPALITDIALSPDDRFLYVACWGTGDLKQFDVSNPLLPREIASVRVGGVAARATHPSQVRRLNGGPGRITVSRDGRRIYVTNALSHAWDMALYPDGLQGWMVKMDADPSGITFDPNFFVDFGNRRPLRVCLPGQGLG